jgi:protoporphyrinogen oxidase
MRHRVVIIGGGLSGISAALHLCKQNISVTIIEKESRLGGLAASFTKNGKDIPLVYHQILSTDKHLIRYLKRLNLYDKTKWKVPKFGFWFKKRAYQMSSLIDFGLLPINPISKIRFVLFMFYCFLRKNWKPLEYTKASGWIEKIAGKTIKEEIFDRLSEIKFGVDSSKISAAWLGSRLHAREGSSNFGWIDGKNWTEEIINGLVKGFNNNVKIIKGQSVKKIVVKNNKVCSICLRNNKLIQCDSLISTVPPEIFAKLLPEYKDDRINSCRYMASLSVLMGTMQHISKFYWLTFLKPRLSFDGVFQLTDINPTLGPDNEKILNIFKYFKDKKEFFNIKDEKIITDYVHDLKKTTKCDVTIKWHKINRIPFSTPAFTIGYKNLDIKGYIKGLYFAGVYKEYPLITTTGTALYSGEKTAQAILRDIHA